MLHPQTLNNQIHWLLERSVLITFTTKSSFLLKLLERIPIYHPEIYNIISNQLKELTSLTAVKAAFKKLQP